MLLFHIQAVGTRQIFQPFGRRNILHCDNGTPLDHISFQRRDDADEPGTEEGAFRRWSLMTYLVYAPSAKSSCLRDLSVRHSLAMQVLNDTLT